MKYYINTKIIDARLMVPQHRERILIVGLREPLKFEWPDIEDQKPKLKTILEENVDDKYTLTDGVWRALQRHSKRHKAKGQGFGYSIADPEGISRTMSARYYKDGAEILIEQKGKNPRRLTPHECLKLQGYPSHFVFPDTVSDVQSYKQLGNSVAVPVVERICENLVYSLKNRVKGSYQEKLLVEDV